MAKLTYDKEAVDEFLEKNSKVVQESLKKQKSFSREEMIAQFQRNHKASMQERKRVKKILFLDIDGPLNTNRNISKNKATGFRDRFGDVFNPIAVDNLSRIVSDTSAEIVISSSWKFFGLDEMKEMWKKRKLAGKVIGITPNSISDEMLLNANLDEMDGLCFKGVEIKEWLSKNGEQVKNYAIIDDENNFLPEQQSHLVQINPEYGISKEDAEKAIRILNS